MILRMPLYDPCCSDAEDLYDVEQILLQEMAYLRIVVHEENGKFIGHRIIPLDALQTGQILKMLLYTLTKINIHKIRTLHMKEILYSDIVNCSP